MPVLPVQCPQCGGLFPLDSAVAGQPITCPLCQGVIVISHEPPVGQTAATSGSDLLPPVHLPRLAEQRIDSDSADLLPPPAPGTSAARQPPIAELLPPGAFDPASPRIEAPLPPPTIVFPSTSEQPQVIVATTAPTIHGSRPQAAVRQQSPQEKAARRLRKNAILFGFFIVVLIVVFYLLAR